MSVNLSKETNELHIFHKSFWQNFEKARFSKILKNELFQKLSEPSRAELFTQKLEPKTELSEPSLGSGATLEFRFKLKLKTKSLGATE